MKKNETIRTVISLTEQLMKTVSDEKYLRIMYLIRTGKRLNLNSPTTFNEKLQWLKLNNRDPRHTSMVDKYEVKKIVASLIGEEHIIPTIGVWNCIEEIDFDMLPTRFVIKCTHDSGSTIICRDKKRMREGDIKKQLKSRLRRNYYYHMREWPYKNVKPRIIIEEYMENEGVINLPVYKLFCFMGKPTIIQFVQNDKTELETIDYYDVMWNRLELRQNFPNNENKMERPKQLEEMIDLAHILSKDFPFIRTDFYIVGEMVYFSEFTFFSDSGMARFYPDEWDLRLGDLIKLHGNESNGMEDEHISI